jgi:nucleoporin POM152
MSPISTAHLNPHLHTFCLSPHTGNTVLIPILLNNTEVSNVRYTIIPLGYVGGESVGGSGKIDYVELSAKDLKGIEDSRAERLQAVRPSGNGNPKLDVEDYEYDEYDDEDSDDYSDSDTNGHSSHSSLQKTQSITHIRIKKPGTVRLERVLDTSNTAARLSHPLEVIVAPCPTVEFAPDKLQPVRCAGQSLNSDIDTDVDLGLAIDLKGVPPLSLRWFKEVNGKREHFLVEGIESEHHQQQQQQGNLDVSELPLVVTGRRKSREPKELKVPLEISLDAVGRHTYVLEEVIDGVGNTVVVEHLHTLAHKLGFGPGQVHDTNATLPANTKTTRFFSVLRRPSMSFKQCGPGSPTSLLIGSETPLTISVNDADTLDAPWDVTVKYQPPPAAKLESLSGSAAKKFKPWKKSLTTQMNKKELTLQANAPGEYTLVGVKGKVSLFYF